MSNLKLLVMMNNQMFLTQIEEVASELGSPDCKLTEPFLINDNDSLVPWLMDVTNENVFMIHSDKILTITEPNSKLKEKYLKLVKN